MRARVAAVACSICYAYVYHKQFSTTNYGAHITYKPSLGATGYDIGTSLEHCRAFMALDLT